MGSRFLTFVAYVLLGFALMKWSDDREPELYVPPLAPVGYRAPAGRPSAVTMAETSASAAPYSQQNPNYDWRTNAEDWRFQLVACLPFGLLYIMISLLQKTTLAEQRAEEEECEITAISGMVPPEYCSQTLAMA
jgi:hypothetical protein